MKQFYLFLSLMCFNLCTFAQETSMVVDCQNPGWLSSMITYGNQKTIQNLKVSGYINTTDLKFIGEMMSKQSLRGCIDLEYVNIVGATNEDNVMPENSFNINWSSDYPDGLQVSHIKFPLSITQCKGSLSGYVKVDTITIGSTNMPVVKSEDIYPYNSNSSTFSGAKVNKRVRCIILRDGVTEIPDGAFNNYNSYYTQYCTPKEECIFDSIIFPSTLNRIGSGAFRSCFALKDFNLPDNLETIEQFAFSETSFSPDTLALPYNLKTYYTNAFETKEGQIIDIKENLETFDNESWTIDKTTRRTYVIHRIIPPIFRKGAHYSNYLSSYSDGKELSNCMIYVPKEGFSMYIDPKYDSVGGSSYHWSGWANPYSYANIQTIAIKASSVEINHTTANLIKGTTLQLTATVLPLDADSRDITWSSSNTNIATVSSDGIVTALESGEAEITATLDADNTLFASCKVKVIQPVTELHLNTYEKELKVGDSFTLMATISPSDADNKNIIWESDDTEIVSVDNGKVTALKAGETYVRAISEDNQNIVDRCLIKVTQPVTGITLNYSEYTFGGIGSTLQIEATIMPENASNKNINWKSSNENVCIVSNGKVVAVGFGTSVIIATTVDGAYIAVCTIMVEEETGLIPIQDSDTPTYKIYDIGGKEIPAFKTGVNIIKFSNGSSVKIVK